ncbi:hypothetical protein KCM76_08600 [Zooshikella marina]|uniref:hypothetical protein n=1 Tax=Zooshikella ganghwensis TaxID=202772 RepID=UPI001BAF5C5F|nr:hypothetical protein [Zooshikella ganghwensis]MBU2706041.1 hypothetical protein [Zooshikella ganghwensis]
MTEVVFHIFGAVFMIIMSWQFFLTPILISLLLRKLKKIDSREWKKMTILSTNPYMIGGEEKHRLQEYLKNRAFTKHNSEAINKIGVITRASFLISNRLFYSVFLIIFAAALIIEGVRFFFDESFLM